MLLCVGASLQGENFVKSGDFKKRLILTGSLKAQKAEHFVVPRTNSFQIQIKWMAPEGADVRPGDPVVRFDTSNLLSEIENSEMALRDKQEQKVQKLAENRHEKLELELQLKQAEIEHEKRKLDAAVPESIVSRYEYDRNQLELKKSAETLKRAQLEKRVRLAAMGSELRRLEIEILEKQKDLEKYQKMLASLTLPARTAGTFVYAEHEWQGRKIQVGDTVFATMTVATVPDLRSLLVEAWALEPHVHQLKPGLPVDMTLDAYPERRFNGVIRNISNNAEKRPHWGKAHYFMVSIGLKSLDLAVMKPGMSVQCQVHLAEMPEVLLIPLEMTHFDGRFFWIKPAGKKAIKVNPLGHDDLFLVLADDGTVKTGMHLESINTSAIESKNHEEE